MFLIPDLCTLTYLYSRNNVCIVETRFSIVKTRFSIKEMKLV